MPDGQNVQAAPQIDFAKPPPVAIDFSTDPNSMFSGATGLKAPPKVFSSDWFKEKADRASDYLGAAGAAIGGLVGMAGGPPGAIAGSALGGAAGEAGRELVQRGLGTNYNVPDTSLGAAGQIAKEGAVQGALTAGTEGIGALGKAIAPTMAESSLGIGAAMRGRGRTIGQSVLENTGGIGPGAVSESASHAVDNLTNELESRINQATTQGAMGTTLPAHQVLNDAAQAIPRNAKTLFNKVQDLRDVLDLRPAGSIGPAPVDYTPNELLEMKRGIGKEIDTWPPEWKRMPEVKRVQMKLYGAIDQQLDHLAPGTGQINQQISSLIPAIKQGAKEADQAGLVQNVAHRLGAHTGALAGAGIGGALGYQKGGTEGAVLGSTLGLIGPELLSSPQGQMLAARTLFNLPRAAVPLSTLAGGIADYLKKPTRPEDEQ